MTRITCFYVFLGLLTPEKKKEKKRKKKEKRSSKKCENRTIWTMFLKFKLAEKCVFFDETPESSPRKRENTRKIFRRGLDILRRIIFEKRHFLWPNQRPRVRPKAELWDVV